MAITKAQKERKRKLDYQINKLSKQTGMSKQAVLDDISLKTGNLSLSASDLAKKGGGKLTKLLNNGLKYDDGSLTTSTERKNTRQYQSKTIREIEKNAKKLGISPAINFSKFKRMLTDNVPTNTINEIIKNSKLGLDDMITQEKKDASQNLPQDMQQALKDNRWHTFSRYFDRHILFNLLHGDYEELIMLAYYMDGSPGAQYVYSLDKKWYNYK